MPTVQPYSATAQLKSLAGTVALPGITFTGDTDTGLYSPAANQVAITTGGVQRLLIGSDGSITLASPLLFPLGSAAAPSVSFTGDTNTGIYSPGADQVSVATGGTERLRIDAAGQIEAVSLGTAAAPIFSFTTDPNTGIYSPGADQLAISTNGQGRLFINSAGDIGIGWASPSYDLHLEKDENALTTSYFRNINTGSSAGSRLIAASLVGNLTFAAYSAAHSVWPATTVISSDSGFTGGMAINAAGANPLRLFTDSTERLRITSAGLVGIGTSAPASTLHVEGLGNTVNQRIFTSDNVSNATASLTFGTTPGSRSKAAIRMINVNTGNTQGALSLLTDTGTSGLVDRLYIDGNGRVGIGTTSPLTRQQTNINSAAEWTSGEQLVGTTNASTTAFYLLNEDSSITATETSLVLGAGGSAGAQHSIAVKRSGSNTGDLIFRRRNGSGGSLESLRIDSSGRLLVGTSSSADLNANVQSIGTTAYRFYGFRYGSDSGILTLGSANGTQASPSALTSPNLNLGILQFRSHDGVAYQDGASISAVAESQWSSGNCPTRLVLSTTAASASSPTERLRITSAGLVGIGTSTPSGRLESAGVTGTTLIRAVGQDTNGNADVEILSTGTTGQSRLYFSDTAAQSGRIIYNHSTNAFTLSTNATAAVTIDSSQQVGIGTTTPGSYSSAADDLVVAGSGNTGITIAAGSSSYSAVYFADGTTGTEPFRGIVGYNHASDGLELYTAGLLRSTIDSAGRLLVGTSSTIDSPYWGAGGRLLQVATNNATAVQIGSYVNTASGAGLIFQKSRSGTVGSHVIVQNNDRIMDIAAEASDGTAYKRLAAIQALVDGTTISSTSMPGRLVFATTADGASSPTERLRITSAGNVGIGTASPDYTLNVQGTVGVGKVGVSGTYNLFWAPNTVGQSVRWIRNNSGELAIGEGLTAGTNEHLRIDPSGRLLVGTSTSVNDTFGASLFQVSRTDGNIGSLGKYGADSFAPLLYFRKSRGALNTQGSVLSGDGIGSLVFTASDGTGFISCAQITAAVDGTPGTNDMPGRLVFSVTADGASSPTERMRIDSSGRVGIGTASPNTALSIDGSSAFGAFGSGAPIITLKNTDTNNFNAAQIVNRDSGGNIAGGIAFRNDSHGASGSSSLLFYTRTGGTSIAPFSLSGAGTGVFDVPASTSPLQVRINSLEVARIDSSGRLLVGTSSARSAGGNFGSLTGKHIIVETTDIAVFTGISNKTSGATALVTLGGANGSSVGSVGIVGAGAELGRLQFVGADGVNLESVAASIGAFVDGTPGANDMPGRLVFSTTADGASSPTERMRITSAGNVGIGTASPGSALNIGADGDFWLASSVNTVEEKNLISWRIEDGSEGARISAFREALANAPHSIIFSTRTSDGLTDEKARIDSSGSLLVGTSSSSADAKFIVQGGKSSLAGAVNIQRNAITVPSANRTIGFINFTNSANDVGATISATSDEAWSAGTSHPTQLAFSTTANGASSPTERMRITNVGSVLVGKTVDNTTDIGTVIGPDGYGYFVRGSNVPLVINRLTTDGTLVSLRQDSTEEGTISVSGTTVSYNGAHLSRWSQLPSGQERTEILRGTVLSNIDEMCEWGDEDNEQLNRMKVSDVEGDKNVSGVFQAWDDDDDTYTNDFYCAMTGDFIIRIGAGVTVERGDLLMSAGDGTAKPQDDDIIRSKTIAKVTSTNVSCTYDDGSYCVPCVLMAC